MTIFCKKYGVESVFGSLRIRIRNTVERREKLIFLCVYRYLMIWRRNRTKGVRCPLVVPVVRSQNLIPRVAQGMTATPQAKPLKTSSTACPRYPRVMMKISLCDELTYV